jgi:hypothetical protein
MYHVPGDCQHHDNPETCPKCKESAMDEDIKKALLKLIEALEEDSQEAREYKLDTLKWQIETGDFT